MFGDFVGGSNTVLKSVVKDIGNSMPGMDEITSFIEIMKQVKSMKFSCVVFDTAPTGHTLRLLSFPSLLDKNIGKVLKMQNVQNLVSQFGSMFSDQPTDKLQDQINSTRKLIEEVSKQFKDPVSLVDHILKLMKYIGKNYICLCLHSRISFCL